nr:hypothetical protein [Tanacetum cinerariifolium]
MHKYRYVLNVDYASNETSNGNTENYEILDIALNHKNVATAKILQRLEPRFSPGREVANGRPWAEVKQMTTDEFCPTEEVQRLEDELRHLKLRDMNTAAYTKRFNELALLCPDDVPNEKKKVELYIKGLPEIIKDETTLSRPVMLNEAMRMVHALMEQKIQAKNERIAEGLKRKMGHKAKDCQSKNVASGAIVRPNVVCYGCEERGHKSYECSKRTDQKGGNVQGQPYVIRDAEHNQGPNVVTDETTLSRPVMLNEAMRMVHALMEQKIRAKNERIAEGLKRK